MGNRLRAKNKKTARNKARAYAEGKMPKRHKVAVTRSKRALAKKAYVMA
jgi:hypothetical protein